MDLGESGQPFGAFSFHLGLVLPQVKLHLVSDMPQTALKKDFDLFFEPVEDGGVSFRHQNKSLECFENLHVLPEESVPAPVVGADVDSCDPDCSLFHVLDQNLQLLTTLLDSPNADSRTIGLSSGLAVGIQGKRDLFAGFLHRPPDRHLVDHRAKGFHEQLRHPKRGQGSQQTQLPPDLWSDPLIEIQPQQHSGDRELMTATRTLDLKLPKHYPRKRCQNLRGFSMARFPDELLVIPTAITGKRLLFASHQKFSIPNQDLLEGGDRRLDRGRGPDGV